MTTNEQVVDYFNETIKNYNKAVLGNAPAIKGTRIPISLIIACFRDNMTIEEISENYNISKESIEIAIDFVIQLLDFPFQ